MKRKLLHEGSNSVMSIILPDELNALRELPQWVCFRLVPNEKKGKPDKIPLNPKSGGGAKANDASTWGTFDEAAGFADRHGLFTDRTGGIGFEFANGIAGVDLDDVILPDGTLKPYAQEIAETMKSYTELSPSGTGLHILFKLNVPLSEFGSRRRNDELGIEMYDSGRYFTITGHVYGEAKPIAERTAEMKTVYEKYLAKSEKTSEEETIKPQPPLLPVETSKKLPQGERLPSEQLSDGDLWERMFTSEKGTDIRALYSGDISRYGDDWSRADLALANYLAYWTGNDPYRMDSMFRQSGLIRPKWDEKHGAQTYGEMTIAEAIRATPTYTPPLRANTNVSTGDKESLQHLSLWTPPITGYEYVASGLLLDEIARFQKYPCLLSGFHNFDDAQGGLYTGLFVLGATPSLGKTTLLLQIADNIAMSGNFVLYFSLEQSRLELTTKSISRLTAQRDIKNATTAINIRRGKYISEKQREAVSQAISEYQKFSANISIIELGIDATVTTITDTVKRFMDFTGLRPVIALDYLQLVRPDNDRLGTKDAVDYVIKVLKKMQVDNNLIVIAISSFNRTNYLAPVDYESFKESGSLEYTADVLLGLQPQIMTDDLFNAEKKIKEKREAIDRAVSAIPRKVMLKNLKNRFGRKGYTCGFTYDPRFDLFTQDLSFKGAGNEQTTIL